MKRLLQLTVLIGLTCLLLLPLAGCEDMPLLDAIMDAERDNPLDPESGVAMPDLGKVWRKLLVSMPLPTGMPMPVGRAFFASTTINGKIYVYGGGTDDMMASFNDLIVFDGTNFEAIGLADDSMNQISRGRYVSMVLVDGKPTMFGGRSNTNMLLNTITQYDLASQMFIYQPVGIIPYLMTSAAVRLNDRYYLISGKRSSDGMGEEFSAFSYNSAAISPGTTAVAGPLDGLVGRMGHQAVRFYDSVVVIGGERQDGKFDTGIYQSTNGVGFVKLGDVPADMGARRDFALVNVRLGDLDYLFLIGGRKAGGDGGNIGSTVMNDVWISRDGVNWTQQLAALPGAARLGMRAESLNGQIYLMGGLFANDTATAEVFTTAP
ncbi:MAG: hypothetical protein A2087_11945 [Spirochaetes bacterium GWD1_61_31]|nr:MAG: hypothetical protein A2Y37_07065 [Spirochaetes bacterium GWB1_60_80]OHD30832.1 MAG: hypothetical protein A2004_04590 [Spirochaetes bacterium GWC1_61_12]OHD37383.1 MAG: hypothetical protein A2087_11945 [Spirochaetes bacterium GWD1_61_31]OHD46332.1 MAG: hypothetical protein A2Y35_07340 [Spirochaetes bacterium GWE1_60_18]OHD60939.1 MAG: hypothetical protein A2Y32_12085 [Spirochaetes bacterium GWF1_60_12]HAP42803.1 hypothetical protein [Spirochaetaceae bacterium]